MRVRDMSWGTWYRKQQQRTVDQWVDGGRERGVNDRLGRKGDGGVSLWCNRTIYRRQKARTRGTTSARKVWWNKNRGTTRVKRRVAKRPVELV